MLEREDAVPPPRVIIDPHAHDAVIFDLDGVVTDTASIHAVAWRRTFDDFLACRTGGGSPFTDEDYRRHVDGRPRSDGVVGFLASRGITLPLGSPTDLGGDTVHGLGNQKQRLFRAMLKDGVPVFDSTVSLVRTLQRAGIRCAVVSSSRNCAEVLRSAGLGELFGIMVDGVVADELGLPGKPDPSVLLEAARRLRVSPERAVVVEDAEAGVEAGRKGGFALVVGVDRTGHGAELLEHGADVTVADAADVGVLTVSGR